MLPLIKRPSQRFKATNSSGLVPLMKRTLFAVAFLELELTFAGVKNTGRFFLQLARLIFSTEKKKKLCATFAVFMTFFNNFWFSFNMHQFEKMLCKIHGINEFLSDPRPIRVFACHWLTNDLLELDVTTLSKIEWIDPCWLGYPI